jgi:hypothetical protein
VGVGLAHLGQEEEGAALHGADLAGAAGTKLGDDVEEGEDLAAVLPGGEAARRVEGAEVLVGRVALGGAAHQLAGILLKPPAVVELGGPARRDRVRGFLDQLLEHGSAVSMATVVFPTFDHW